MNYPYLNQQTQGGISMPNPGQAQVPFPQAPTQNQYQSFFPQPIGNVYNLNTSNEIGNIPAGAGMSIGLCLNENVLFIKGLQNGSPMLLGYTLAPIEGAPSSSSSNSTPRQSSNSYEEENRKLKDTILAYDDKIRMLENQIGKIKEKLGGRNEWEI